MARIYTEREVKRRKLNYQIFAGIYDFVALVAGVVVIIACAVLLTALISWIVREAQSSFSSLWKILSDALIVPQ